MMRGSPDVAAVIPTRNRPELLVRAVASVRRQSLPVSEIVVVDDASEAACAASVRTLEGEGVRVISLEERVLGSAARNRGWREADSPLVAFLDDDDTWEPEKVERQVALFEDPDVDYSWTAYRIVDPEDGRVLDEIHPDGGDFRSLLRRSPLACSTLIVRRGTLEAVGGFDESLPRNQDWDLFLRLARRCRGAYLDEVLTVMRRSVPDAEACIRGRRIFIDKWEEEIERLTPRERRRVMAEHEWFLWANHAQMRDLAGERRHLGRALRLDPLEARYYTSALLTLLHHLGWRGRHAGRPGGS